MDKNKIEIRNVYLIFGSERSKAFRMLKKGKSKNEILKETGCTIAVNNASLSVREGKIFVITGLPESSKSSERTEGFDRQLDSRQGRILPINVTLEWTFRLSL